MGTRSGEAGFGDDDRLPWLETVEEDYREGPSIWRILLLILLGLAVLAAVVFGFWWYQKQQGLSSGNGELIAAQEGDYKVPDHDPASNVAGADSATYATGGGATVNGSVDMAAAPETPIEGKTVPKPTPSAVAGTVKATVAVPENGGRLEARAPAGSGSLIQLGAFPDQQGADAAWERMSKRFPQLATLGKSIERGDSNGSTVYRLRVNTGSNGQAKDICAKLQAAKESCYIAN